MKNYILIAMIFCGFLSAQTNPEIKNLRDISEKYYYLLKDYSKKHRKEDFFLKTIDSLSNEYEREEFKQLEKIKEYEEKSFVIPSYKINPCGKNSNDFKTYYKEPNFDKILKNYKSKYSSNELNKDGKGSLKTVVTFTVEKNGEVSFVRANGVNEDFNKQAELTIYKTDFYMPRCVNGFPERANFKMPITMNFE